MDNQKLLQQFANELAKDPDLINKLKKREALSEFKQTYQVTNASPFKCPSCATLLQSPGSLWGPKQGTTNEFVCRKCKLEWKVDCLTKPNEDLVKELREALKS